jgi:diguanylate cyclase (GGDEF)-like protein
MTKDRDDDTGVITLAGSRMGLSRAGVRLKVRPFLVVAAGWRDVGRSVLLEGPTVVGRGDVDLTLDEDGLSRRHARFTPTGTEVLLEDLQSTNGTFVNGERITAPRMLRDGDRIDIGNATTLKFAMLDELQEGVQRRLYEQATRDPLTGAYNKRAFGDALAKEIAFAARHERPLALIVLDGDNFKRVNDTFGHGAGDYVLKTLADVVTGVLRKEDLLARWGGEEFAVLLRDVGTDAATICAERMRATIEKHSFVHEGRKIPFTISVGLVSTVPLRTSTGSELFDRADQCLYTAKASGRNRVVADR